MNEPRINNIKGSIRLLRRMYNVLSIVSKDIRFERFQYEGSYKGPVTGYSFDFFPFNNYQYIRLRLIEADDYSGYIFIIISDNFLENLRKYFFFQGEHLCKDDMQTFIYLLDNYYKECFKECDDFDYLLNKIPDKYKTDVFINEYRNIYKSQETINKFTL